VLFFLLVFGLSHTTAIAGMLTATVSGIAAF